LHKNAVAVVLLTPAGQFHHHTATSQHPKFIAVEQYYYDIGWCWLLIIFQGGLGPPHQQERKCNTTNVSVV
jgi:hypothetical protein